MKLKTLKASNKIKKAIEKYYGKTFETYEELKEAIDYYNYKRIKRKLAGMSQFNTEFIPAN